MLIDSIGLGLLRWIKQRLSMCTEGLHNNVLPQANVKGLKQSVLFVCRHENGQITTNRYLSNSISQTNQSKAVKNLIQCA